MPKRTVRSTSSNGHKATFTHPLTDAARVTVSMEQIDRLLMARTERECLVTAGSFRIAALPRSSGHVLGLCPQDTDDMETILPASVTGRTYEDWVDRIPSSFTDTGEETDSSDDELLFGPDDLANDLVDPLDVDNPPPSECAVRRLQAKFGPDGALITLHEWDVALWLEGISHRHGMDLMVFLNLRRGQI